MAKTRKHSGRKRPNGELMKLNKQKFERKIAMIGEGGATYVPHIDPRYYPTVILHNPINPDFFVKKIKTKPAKGQSPQEQHDADQERKESLEEA